MPPLDEARARLAARQAELVRALTGQGGAPPGFVGDRLRAAATSLERKRKREVALAWPALTAALGRDFGPRFRAFAACTPLPASGGPFADGRAFARTLAADEWTDDLRLAVLAFDLRRRRPALAFVRLRQARRLVVALHLPPFGAYRVALPLGWPPSRSAPAGR
jgi:hypothetical protein